MTLYTGLTYQEADRFITLKHDAGWEAVQVNDGVLGSGFWILYDPARIYPAYTIAECYVNPWASDHTIEEYPDGLPEKYREIVEKWEAGLLEMVDGELMEVNA